jgi:hypothetical protein
MSGQILGSGTSGDPWQLRTPSLTSGFTAWCDPDCDPPALVVQVGSTRLSYRIEAIDDAVTMLRARGGWMELGMADEGKPVRPDTLEAWARDPSNPVGGWYGLRKGYRGRFATYVTPVLEALGLVELEHNPKNNRVRAR